MTECQSCGISLSLGNFGTNASGTYNDEYCSTCFQKGLFTDSDLTLSQMIQIVFTRLVGGGLSEEEARQKVTEQIPNLKRWRNSSV